jgi:serpin B
VRTINRWADRATHGRIKGLLDEPLPAATRLMLANAVYFKGKWADAFDASATRPREFLLASGRRIRVPAMERTGRLAYQRANGFQVVRLPYRGGRSAMYIILPDSGVGTRTLMQQFAAKGWPKTLAKGPERDVHLVLPKFHVEASLDLRKPLEQLGAGIAFDPRRADFRDLAVARSNGAPLPLCVDKAEQKVYIDVSEEGTEAAAVTGLTVVVTSAPPPPMNFVVDRPFLFVLRDEEGGSDLFVGRIGRP